MLLLSSIILTLCGSVLAQSGVKYYYYYSPNVTAIDVAVTPLNDDIFDNTKPLKIICHGAAADSNVDWYNPMITAYLNKGYQVIAIDWGVLANSTLPADFIDEIGNTLGYFIATITQVFNFPLGEVHFIGHSLGAHIGGYVGRRINDYSNSYIGRITGLDPSTEADIILSGKAALYLLDALFVDVIHTNAGVGGITYPCGTADFYPNGGTLQPNCSILDLLCSHNRAPWLFIESINSNNFVSKLCLTWLDYTLGLCGNSEAIMGEGCSLSADGNYFLSTNGSPPYAKG